MSDPTLYLFDGSNLFHAGSYEDRDELVDALASFVALHGARGVGAERTIGRLTVRYAPHADDVLERLAAEHRDREKVLVVTSDAAVRGTAGQSVQKTGSRAFLEELGTTSHVEESASRVRDRLDDETRAKLERLRRGES